MKLEDHPVPFFRLQRSEKGTNLVRHWIHVISGSRFASVLELTS